MRPVVGTIGFLGNDTMADYDDEYAEGKPRSLLIPVKNSDQAVEVFADEIPDDVNDIIDILRAEVAPLDVWLQFAVRLAYFFHIGQCAIHRFLSL